MAFPDVTALLVGWLRTELPDRTIRVDVPSDRPDRFTQVRRIGGPAVPPVVDRPNLDIRCWAPDTETAMVDLLAIRSLVWRLSGSNTAGVTVYDVAEMMGPRHDNDPESEQPFAMMTFSLATRADDAIQWTN